MEIALYFFPQSPGTYEVLKIFSARGENHMENFDFAQKQKSVARFSFGRRELMILILGAVPAFLCAVAPWLPPAWLPIRIGLAVLIGDFALVLAFGRDPKTNATIEAACWQSLRNNFSARFTARPSSASTGNSRGTDSGNLQEIRRWQDFSRLSVPAAWTFQAIPVDSMLVMQAFSYATLAAIIAWLVTGGTQEIIRWIHINVR
jgi:hypothetical protein